MKRRTLAILLTALLVVSVVFVLAACQKEYTVTFRDTSGRVLDTVTTVKGKATATDKATTKAGYTFEDWYKTIGQDDDGNYTYTDKVDLATYEFTEDTDLYAKWKRNLTKGEEAGYCLIGQIYGVTVGRADGEDWDKSGFLPAEAAAEEALQFTYAQNPINLYTKTFDVKVNHKFKMKTSVDTWDGGEINGLANILNEVKLASNVTLPQGIAKASDLFDYEYGIDNNLIAKCDMNLTINFYYNAADSYADVIVNSLDADTVVKEDAEYGFILTGTAGVDFKPGLDPENAEEAPYILTQDATNKNLFTLSEKELAANTSFRLKVNNGAWSGTQYNYSNVTIKFADDLDHEGVTEDDLIVNGGGDDQNLNLVRDIKATISLDAAAKTWTLTITWFSSEAPKTDAELGYLVVCTGNNFYDKGTVDPADPEKGKYVMVVDETKDTLFAVNGLAFESGNAFRVKLNVKGWQKEYNYTNAKFVFATGVTPPAGIADVDAMFKDAGSGFDGHNIIVQGVNITANITLDTSLEEEQLVITITAVTLPDKTNDDYGYIVTGPHTGDPWASSIAADNATLSKYILTQDAENEHLFEVTIQVQKGKQIVVKINKNGDWSVQYGTSAANYVNSTGKDLPTGMTLANIFTGSGNITVNANATLKLTLNTAATGEEKALKVEILEIEATEIKTDAELGMIVVGSMQNPAWTPDNDAFKLTPNADKTVFTITGLELAANAEFKLKVCKSAWDPQWGYHGENMTVEVASGVAGTAADYIGNAEGNIKALKACTVTIVLNYNAAAPANSTYTITITAVPAPEAKIGTTEYTTLAEAIKATKANDTIVLQKDVTLNSQIVIDKVITLDMNGKTIANTEDIYNSQKAKYGFFAVIAGGNLTIRGNGNMLAKANDCYTVSLWAEDAVLNIENGKFVGNLVNVYVFQGTANIKGGEFDLIQLDQEKIDAGGNGYEFMLNLKDAHKEDGTAKLNVTGGSFVNYDPSNSASEALEADFVAEGFEVTSKTENGKTIYTVAAVAAQA